eukprot:CAMPEP_0197636786 /NCGR_PEP_ID=MMETSP1338-20131121/12184_1 /TAXON_ID=43686 ORGANISM="Pelagodinium beii, Strain RCC1491" /NCGR_SAMPLE_ID=MMETSP1338 /ASSEMBLY_ACC=CAM_ASM_000754 /LENGTH=1294 /DNA_ID=CAMNT_0043209085 /DNA_START=101 /DNA_END=3982 /DNA_ORIENTATION=+
MNFAKNDMDKKEDDDLFLAMLAAEVDSADDEVSRIAPAPTPSTAASTPTPDVHHYGKSQVRPQTVMSGVPSVKENSIFAEPCRPGSVACVPAESKTDNAPRKYSGQGGSLTASSPAPPPRPATSIECHTARSPSAGGTFLPSVSGPYGHGLASSSPAPPGNATPQAGWPPSPTKSSPGSPSNQLGSPKFSQTSSPSSPRRQKEQETALQLVAKRLTKALVAYYKSLGGKHVGQPSWTRFLKEIDEDDTGMMSFEEFDNAVQTKLKAAVSRYELRVFWRRLDEDQSGQASAEEFGRLMYRIELAQWPDLTDEEQAQTVRTLNSAAEKWHRAGGNWFKIFNQIDSDGSGNLNYEELVQCVRGTLPCLRLTPQEVSERQLQGLWKALDQNAEIEIPVHRFMVYMRKVGGQDLSMHKLTNYSKAARGMVEEKRSLPPAPERSASEIRAIAAALEKALSCYYIDKGYLSVASASEAAAKPGGGTGGDACGWHKFFKESDHDGSGRLAYTELVKAIYTKLKPWLSKEKKLIVGGHGRDVSKEDIRALWDKLDPSNVGEVTSKDMMLGLYRVVLEGWPDAKEAELEKLATLINNATVRRMRSGGNWYKVFNLVDKEQSGRLSFDQLTEVVRDSWFGLAIAPEVISDKELKMIWKKLDDNTSGDVTVGEFMVFMRKYGAKHNMHKLTRYSQIKRGTLLIEKDWSEEINNAPAMDAPELAKFATDLTLGINAWLQRSGAGKGSSNPDLWAKFVDHSPNGHKFGRLKYAEFESLVKKVVSDKVPQQQMMAFFREVDFDSTGEASAAEFNKCVYKLQIDSWPELDGRGILRCIGHLNAAADKWHRASGNWYKVFLACDEDGSGSMTFDEFMGVMRKSFPGLSIPPSRVSDQELRGFWRELDANRIGRVEVYDFLIFMRKHGAEFSMHEKLRAKAEAPILDHGDPAHRTDDELRRIAQTLDGALAAYWNRRGVHVRAVEKWERFLTEADTDKDGNLTFNELELQLCVRLKGERKGHMDVAKGLSAGQQKTMERFLQDGAVVRGVSHDDLYALWCKLDSDRSGIVTQEEWTLGIYRLWLETWPFLNDRDLGKVVDKIGHAASKWIGKSRNWYKVFNLVDVDGSGAIGYDEFFNIVRRPLPCLAIPTSEISNNELKGLWKSMDNDQSSSVTVQEFMRFMRRLEVQRGFAKWEGRKASEVRGSIMARASAMIELSAAAKKIPEVTEAQQERIKASLQNLTIKDFQNAYSKWGMPWSGIVSEWEWCMVCRELMDISEEDIDDDALHGAWRKIDQGDFGEVPVEAVIELGW